MNSFSIQNQFVLLDFMNQNIRITIMPKKSKKKVEASGKSKKMYGICGICLNEAKLGKFTTCGHAFCWSCINEHIQEALRSSKILTCMEADCGQFIDKECKAWFKLKDKSKKQIQRAELMEFIRNNPNTHLCPQAECAGIIQVPSFPFSMISSSQCNACHLKCCSICFSAYHSGQCDFAVSHSLVLNSRFRTCNSCRRVVQKNQGCDHMTCLCGYQFCYKCGQKYHPNTVCQPTQPLTGLSLMRWSIQRQQLWFQKHPWTIGNKVLNGFNLAGLPISPTLKYLLILLYTLTLFPVHIAFFSTLFLLFFTICLLVVILLPPFACIKDNYEFIKFVRSHPEGGYIWEHYFYPYQSSAILFWFTRYPYVLTCRFLKEYFSLLKDMVRGSETHPHSHLLKGMLYIICMPLLMINLVQNSRKGTLVEMNEERAKLKNM